ncbi:MAG: hypothetical protein ABI759_10610 [Candidatus Solibacter sp.]
MCDIGTEADVDYTIDWTASLNGDTIVSSKWSVSQAILQCERARAPLTSSLGHSRHMPLKLNPPFPLATS